MLDRFELFSTSIHNVYKYITKIERDEMEKYGLKGAYAQYLVIMSRFPEGITSAKLSEICDKDKAAISRIVAEMEEKGLLVRMSGKENLYRAKLVLTDEGHAAAEYVCDKAMRAVALAGGNLGEEERRIMYGALAIIETNLRRISRDGIPSRCGEKSENR
jgi:DNA-binding MarR family transcriptional regulator